MEKHEQRVEANQESQKDSKGNKGSPAEVEQELPRLLSPTQIPHKSKRAYAGKQ
jgi:hypothetical protein